MNRQFKVAFYLRTGYKAKDGKVPVIARIYLNNERMTLGSAGVNVDPAQWDSKAGRVKGRKPDAISTNSILERLEQDLVFLFHRHELDEDLTLELLKSKYLGKESSKKKDSFLEFFQQIIGEVKNEVGTERSYASYQKYNVLYKHFCNFLHTRLHRNDIAITELSFKVISEFVNYLLSDGGCAHNTAMKFLGNFKTLTIRAQKLGLLEKDPFADFKIRFKKVDRGFLTDEEIDTIMQKDIKNPTATALADLRAWRSILLIPFEIDVPHEVANKEFLQEWGIHKMEMNKLLSKQYINHIRHVLHIS